MLLNSVSLVW